MATQEVTLINRLLEAPSPRQVQSWRTQDDYYVEACRISKSDIPDLIEVACKWSDFDWPGDSLGPEGDPDRAELLPVTAWRSLAELGADAAVEPLIDMLRELDGELDDWSCEELPAVFGKIGEAAIEPLTRLAKDTSEREYVRTIAVRGLKSVVDFHEHTRGQVVPTLIEMLANGAVEHRHSNSSLLVALVDLNAVEAAETIERAFANDCIDLAMMGDWEKVRAELGVEGLGLKMPSNPHNSLGVMRSVLGVGIYSEDIIFSLGDIDHDAANAYYDRACEAFSNSPEGKQVIERDGDIGWCHSLLEYGVDYAGQTVDRMSVASIEDYLFDYVPRKVSTVPSRAGSIVYELQMFWKFLDRKYELAEAKAIVDWLESPGLADQLEAELDDSSNYGMAKSMFMAGQSAGFDMTTQEGLDQFRMAFNRSITPEPEPLELPDYAPAVAPIERTQQRVGRNDPCPCGSGRKYKKCCGSAG